ncbi:alpha/beta fold hydrolase [Glaciihabitans tibetensis]|nr:alpha/beta hydrolase [Glaciihabitans tibetensis]
MTEFVTSSAGDRVAYDKTGMGPALIFVAGAMQHRASDPLTTATAEAVAAQSVTAIVYDRLGRGESQVDDATHQSSDQSRAHSSDHSGDDSRDHSSDHSSDHSLDLPRELAAITALLEVAGGSAVLCGHSSGCSIALAAAATGLPVNGLVLWEAPLAPQGSGGREWAEEVERRVDAGDLEGALLHYMKDMPPEWLEGARSAPFFPALVAQAPSLLADAQSLAWAESAPHGELFASIRVPVEVMYGEQTLPIMEQAAESIVNAIPGAVQKRMPGANHSWEAEPMAQELAAFVHVSAVRPSA